MHMDRITICCLRPKENIALFPAHRPGENYLWCYSAAKKNLFSIMKFRYACINMVYHALVYFVFYLACFMLKSNHETCLSSLLWPKKIKFRIFDDIYLYIFSKKNIFAAARMRFIFVTRCTGNKAIFSFGLYWMFTFFVYLHRCMKIWC